MSAWIVSKAHIDLLVSAGLRVRYRPMCWYVGERRGELNNDNASAVGQMLLDECVKSVNYRYSDDQITELLGPTNAYWLIPYKFDEVLSFPSIVCVLKQIDCYEYQSCEHPEWKDSEAHTFCRALRKYMIHNLPGYEEAPWGWDE